MPYEFIFTDHFFDRYRQQYKRTPDTVSLANQIKTNGVFFAHKDGGLVCVVNNLDCYGVTVDSNKLAVTTIYPYTQTFRRFLNKLLRAAVDGVGKPCRDGVPLDELVRRGWKPQHQKSVN